MTYHIIKVIEIYKISKKQIFVLFIQKLCSAIFTVVLITDSKRIWSCTICTMYHYIFILYLLSSVIQKNVVCIFRKNHTINKQSISNKFQELRNTFFRF